MNQRIEIAPVTTINASSVHDAMLLDVIASLKAITAELTEAGKLHFSDQGDAFQGLQSRLEREASRVGSLVETADEFASNQEAAS